MRPSVVGIAAVLLGSIFGAIGAALPQEQADPTVTVAKFQGDKAAAISFTFDDGLQEHRDIAAPMFANFRFHSTFYVVAGMAREHKSDPVTPDPRLKFGEGRLSWEEIREIAAMGHEIGNHSLTHPFLPRIADDAALHAQVATAKDLITSHVGVPPVTFACPYNEMSPRVRKEILASHAAIREPWTDWGGKDFTAERANLLVDQAIARGEWLVPMIHGIDGNFLPLSSEVCRNNLSYIKLHEGQVWVDTFGNVARYVRERNAARVDVQAISPSSVTFTVTTGLDSAVYNVPLTLTLAADDDEITDLRASRGGQALPVRVEGGKILVDAAPSALPITVTWE